MTTSTQEIDLGALSPEHLKNVQEVYKIMAFLLDEDANYGLKYQYRAKVWKVLNKPYRWWGTCYELNFNKKDFLSGKEWDDYDEFGKAYWDKES